MMTAIKSIFHFMRFRRKDFIEKRFIAKHLRAFPIRHGDVVLDFGANIGHFSEYCLERGAEVHAYEPNSDAFEYLKRLEHKYQSFYGYNCAVSNHSGGAKLYMHHSYSSDPLYLSESSSLFEDKNNVNSNIFNTVRCVDIRSILAQFNKIRIIKIDIEGGEYAIINDIINKIEKIDLVIMETHGEKIPSLAHLHSNMLEHIRRCPDSCKILLNWR